MFPLTEQVNCQAGDLSIDDVRIDAIAQTIETPFYCYSHARLLENIQCCKDAFESRGISIHYAVRANSNIHLLRVIQAQGLGVDLVSGGELNRVMAAGFTGQQMVFSGVGKSASELHQAIESEVGQFNVESTEELALLADIANSLNKPVRVALRVNPQVVVNTHKHITTGAKGNKFGIEPEQAIALYQQYAEHAFINIVGLAMHIGSQIFDTAPYRDAIQKILVVQQRIEQAGGSIDVLDLGGGFGVSYEGGSSLGFEEIAELISEETSDFRGRVFVEPGRSLVADTGLLISRVLYVKSAQPRSFLILDAAMNDLMRPALYQAVQPMLEVKDKRQADTQRCDIVGPICESTDTFARDYSVSDEIAAGDLVAFFCVGAYGAVMSNAYNSRDIIPEVLVKDGEFKVIRQRIDQSLLMGFEGVSDL